MRIQNMFQDDINRKINGVIKVNQDDLDVIKQEVREYVITRELKKHFMTFFNYYCEMFDNPNADIGVWLSGFFGSGKSHLLKMLSYILENKEIDGETVVEMFRNKFSDDPATFMLIDRATRVKAETILFNIDIEGSINKDKTAVLRVFAKMFYNHLGFYGENLKVAQMEYYIEQVGKTEEFRRVFEEKRGMSWEQARKAFSFNGKYIVPTLMEVLDMTEKDADSWFRDKSAVEMSIALLADEIRTYVEKKPKDFRLLFMIDEVGQYVGTDTDMLINLQSLVEEIGRTCGAKVWVMCTGQEALDEIIKVRQSEFSRIQARFKVHLSLTSSSADEVIQKRLLKKTNTATELLEGIYTQSDSVLRNLFTFKDAMLDIKGYSGPQEFAINFPFVPYQFLLIQKIFSEIRKHGNAGKHYSGAERSMLDGFQIAVKKIQTGDEYNLAPLFSFYDSIHEFLDGSIRRVIERCANAAASGAGIEPLDVDVLKLLYLIRYVPQDMPANLDNLVILMADNINVDPISMRKTIAESLNRLFSQNYIGRSGDTYNFLTDEEQDIWKEINAMNVDTASMKDYMASGSFARGKEEKAASASMVFVGNINQSVDVLLKTSSLFDPFPPEMGTDTAFLDRIHCYLPGWEVPKFRPEHFTDDYGFITDYLAEFIRELRKEQYGDALDHYFRLGKNLNQRDTIAVRRTVDGLLKLLYPDGEFSKEDLEEILQIALEMRRRVKEQLKKLGGMEFYDVNFSYIDNDSFEEHYVSVPEQGGGKLIPEGICNPGQVYTVSRGKSGMIGVFRLESQMLPGNGKFERTGIGSDRDARESSNTAFNYLKANGNRISGSISTTTKDYIINYQDLQGIGITGKLALPSLIALCSIALGRPTLGSLAVLGEISISGTMIKVDELANTLQCCLDSGAKKVLIPSVSMMDFATVPADLMGAFQLIPYSSAEDAVFKALGVD